MPPKRAARRFPPWLGLLVGAAMLAVAFFVLKHELAKYRFSEVLEVFGRMPAWRIVLAVVATLAGFAALVAHDVIGLEQIRRPLPLRRTALAAFVAYAFSNSAPFSFAVAGAMRLRFYHRWGLGARAVTRVVGIGITTYALGLLAAVSIALTIGNFPMPKLLPLPFHTTLPVGLLAGLVLAGYLVWVRLHERARSARGGSARNTLGFALRQIVVSLADWVCSGAALYVLLIPKTPLDFLTFFGLFILGQLVSLVAQLPGGIGVFEAVLIRGLRPYVPPPAALAALVGYRVVYYLLPLIAASAILLFAEARHATHRRDA